MEEGLVEKEQEFHQLLESLRNAQADRQHYVDELMRRTRHMEQEIVALEAEHANLSALLVNANSTPNQRKDDRNCEDLANLADNKEWLEQQIEDEKTKQAELDVQIRETTRKLMQNQREGGCLEGVKSTYIKNTKRISTLHSRLQNGLKQYNALLASNANLREEIDTLRCERMRYDQIYKKLDIELTKMRVETSALINEATVAYHQREECNLKMQMLKEKTDRDMASHNVEMKELVRVIDYSRRLKAFMDNKSKERDEDPQYILYKARKDREAQERRAEEENTQVAYETAFCHITEQLGTNNLSLVVPMYMEREDRIFSLYNYVNELHSQYDTLKMEVFDLRTELQKSSDCNDISIRRLQGELVDTSVELQTFESHMQSNEKLETSFESLFVQTAERIRELFDLLGCDEKHILSRLAAPKVITKETVLLYMEAIEEQVNKYLVSMNYVLDSDPTVAHPQIMPLTGASIIKNPESAAFLPPNLTEDFEYENLNTEALKPLSRVELATKVMRTVAKKEREVKDNPAIGQKLD